MALIKSQKRVTDDPFVFIENEQDIPQDASIIVSQTRFLEQRDTLLARNAPVGVRIAPEDNPRDLLDDLPNLALLAIWFPKYADGRGYSHARLLRDRYGWEGELRATGDVKRDQLFYMQRCGFDAYELPEGQSIESALEGFSDFEATYQTAADGRAPVYHQGS